MKWKCNTFECGHVFETSHTEKQIEDEKFNLRKEIVCPKCKDPNNSAYRYDKCRE